MDYHCKNDCLMENNGLAVGYHGKRTMSTDLQNASKNSAMLEDKVIEIEDILNSKTDCEI